MNAMNPLFGQRTVKLPDLSKAMDSNWLLGNAKDVIDVLEPLDSSMTEAIAERAGVLARWSFQSQNNEYGYDVAICIGQSLSHISALDHPEMQRKQPFFFVFEEGIWLADPYWKNQGDVSPEFLEKHKAHRKQNTTRRQRQDRYHYFGYTYSIEEAILNAHNRCNGLQDRSLKEEPIAFADFKEFYREAAFRALNP